MAEEEEEEEESYIKIPDQKGVQMIPSNDVWSESYYRAVEEKVIECLARKLDLPLILLTEMIIKSKEEALGIV